MMDSKEVLYLLDMGGEPIRAITDDRDTEIESVNKGHSVLTTRIGYDENITTEMQLIWRGQRFVIVNKMDGRDSGSRVTSIEAESVFMELSEKYTDISMNQSSVYDIVFTLLKDTRWTVGDIPSNIGGRHNIAFKGDEVSILSILRFVEDLTDGVLTLDFDTLNYKVNFIRTSNIDVGFMFSYGKNIKEISRETFAPKATIIIPTGNNDLDISVVNPTGKKYVENFDYYINQGYSYEEAKRLFSKVTTFVDERYHLAGNLMREAERRLDVLAFPQITYKTTIAYMDQDVRVGSVGYVQDTDLGIRVKTEVVRLIERRDKRDSEVELNYLIPGMGALQEHRSTAPTEAKMAMVENESVFTSSTTYYKTLMEISVTNMSVSNLEIGFGLYIETEVDGMIFDGYFDVDGVRVSVPIKQSLLRCQNLGFPFIATQIPEGSHRVRLLCKSEGGTFTIQPNDAQMYIKSETLATGSAPTTPDTNITEEVEFIPYMYVEENVVVDIKEIE